MPRVLVVYQFRTGNTAKMADAVDLGARSAGAEAMLKNLAEIKLEDLTGADGIIIGPPTYYDQMAAEIKGLFDISSEIRGRLENKAGVSFTYSASVERSHGHRDPLWVHSSGRAKQGCP